MSNKPTINLEGLTIDDKLALLTELGDVVLEASILRLVGGLTSDQQEALEQFMETEPDPEALLKHIFSHHKDFERILTEEAQEKENELVEIKEG